MNTTEITNTTTSPTLSLHTNTLLDVVHCLWYVWCAKRFRNCLWFRLQAIRSIIITCFLLYFLNYWRRLDRTRDPDNCVENTHQHGEIILWNQVYILLRFSHSGTLSNVQWPYPFTPDYLLPYSCVIGLYMCCMHTPRSQGSSHSVKLSVL
jgi:hypothetical protein